MFGYINVNGAQLSEENKKIYQSYYCGLCRKLKEFCGKKGQALLNYDMTFLVVLLTGLYEPDTQTGEFTCMMHPMKKRQLRENDIQSYAAQMNVLLAYYNLVDDWKDDHNYTKKTIASMFEKDYQRIKINYPRQTNAIEQYMEKLAAYEAEKQTNIDLVAVTSGSYGKCNDFFRCHCPRDGSHCPPFGKQRKISQIIIHDKFYGKPQQYCKTTCHYFLQYTSFIQYTFCRPEKQYHTHRSPHGISKTKCNNCINKPYEHINNICHPWQFSFLFQKNIRHFKTYIHT